MLPAEPTLMDVEQPVTCDEMIGQLRALGVQPGGLLLVHAAFSAIRPVEDGPLGLIWSLLHALGHEGTLLMPSLADDDGLPFDPLETPCNGMGVVADLFWRLPDTLRSDSPHAFAALGPLAEALTAPHPLTPAFGADSPAGRALAADAQVLLLGVGQEANAMLQVAAQLAGGAIDGLARLDASVDASLDAALDAAGLQRRGLVGHAPARLMRASDVVRTARALL